MSRQCPNNAWPYNIETQMYLATVTSIVAQDCLTANSMCIYISTSILGGGKDNPHELKKTNNLDFCLTQIVKKNSNRFFFYIFLYCRYIFVPLRVTRFTTDN